jgi:hypothetical protein
VNVGIDWTASDGLPLTRVDQSELDIRKYRTFGLRDRHLNEKLFMPSYAPTIGFFRLGQAPGVQYEQPASKKIVVRRENPMRNPRASRTKGDFHPYNRAQEPTHNSQALILSASANGSEEFDSDSDSGSFHLANEDVTSLEDNWAAMPAPRNNSPEDRYVYSSSSSNSSSEGHFNTFTCARAMESDKRANDVRTRPQMALIQLGSGKRLSVMEKVNRWNGKDVYI